ncbi:MAG: class I SAM-dependent methyltransferase [Ruminiclostridium sp.]
MIRLDPRLAAIAKMVRLNRRICDVGTDHALLPCYLREAGAGDIIACDINEGPLEAAAATVAKYGAGDCIKLIKSDGLESVPPCEDIIVAGMGGELIARIVTECRFITPDTRFILQPMTKAEVLRRELYKSGFEIEREEAAKAAGKIYTVMLVKYTGIKTEIEEKFAYFGKNESPEYSESVKKRLLKLSKGNPDYKKLID